MSRAGRDRTGDQSFWNEVTPVSLPRNGYEEKNGGVTGARALANTSDLGALPIELFGNTPKAGFEPALPLDAK
jgi:hypothetical protein